MLFLTADWSTTKVDHGYIDVKWQNTAPHRTEYYKVYITPLNWNPTIPLRWNDLIEIGHRGKGPAESFTTIRSFIPDSYAGKRAALVSVWQRDFNDSHEAFYSVSDIQISGSDGGDGGDGGSRELMMIVESATSTTSSRFVEGTCCSVAGFSPTTR